MAYLAAVPAASRRSAGRPSVIALPVSGEIAPEVADYLKRYKPTEAMALGLALGASPPEGVKWTAVGATSADAAARELATRFWESSTRVVACGEDDYGSGLLASSLAALLDCPLIYCGERRLSRETIAALKKLGVRTVLTIGDVPRRAFGRRRRVVPLAGIGEVIEWAAANEVPCDYFALANPFDRRGTLKTRLSLIAPLLSAARKGLVIPLEYESHWMKEVRALVVTGDASRGVAEGIEPPLSGSATFGQSKVNFVLVKSKGSREGPTSGGPLYRIHLDLDSDGRFDGAGEGPFWSTDAVTVGAKSYTVIAAVRGEGKKQKVSLQTCHPTPEEIDRRLRALWSRRGGPPTYLCIVGHPDAVPFWLCLDGPTSETFVASDVPWANADADPFFEIAVGRIIAEDARAATLHASRIVTYPSLIDDRWAGSVGFARWEDSLGPQFANAGFLTQYHHSKHDRPSSKDDKGRTKYEGSFDQRSPLRNVAALVHGAHSWYMGLGETYTVGSDVLLSPCIVESAGCGTTALHFDKKFISVVARLFRNGAVAFSGNSVPSPAPHQELRYAFWNSVLGGNSTGVAHRHALNCKMLTVLEADQLERGGVDRRTMIMRHLYGDPAFTLQLPHERRVRAAAAETKGDTVTLLGPGAWYTVQIRVPEDWKDWNEKLLYVTRAPGVYARAEWCGEKYDTEEVFADASFTTLRQVRAIEQIQEFPDPLGWSGRYFEDVNADGTRTYRWRVRMADFVQTTGFTRGTVDRVEFRVRY
jgi:hypothetical protein